MEKCNIQVGDLVVQPTFPHSKGRPSANVGYVTKVTYTYVVGDLQKVPYHIELKWAKPRLTNHSIYFCDLCRFIDESGWSIISRGRH